MKVKWLTATSKPIIILLLLIVQTATGQSSAAKSVAASGRVSQNPSVPDNAQPPQPPQPICPAQLGNAIEAITARPQFQRARWGMAIETLSGSETLYARERDRYFIPASNVKLLTTAAALLKLGPQFRIRTSVYSASADPNIKALRLVGRGDPSLTDAQLRELAQQLKRQGYSQVQQLTVDNGYFSPPLLHPTWEWEDVNYYYGAQVNSLIVNQNAVELKLFPQTLGSPLRAVWSDAISAYGWQLENNTVTSEPGTQASVELRQFLGKPVLAVRGQLPVGAQPSSVSLAVIDPAESFLRHLRVALALQQINVAQLRVASDTQTSDSREVAAVESPPLATLIADTNQPSNNLYAEALLRTLGVTNNEGVAQNQNTAESGLAAVKQALTKIGVNPQSYVQVDGSGLSRHNLVSPDTLVQTLKGMARTPVAEVYRASLPVAGVSGTLRNRFRNTPAIGIVQAKTGTLTGAVSLSGYLNPANYQPLVFSIVVNQSDQLAGTSRQAIDDIVLLLTRLRRC